MIVFLLLLLTLLSSCSAPLSPEREIYLVSVADDFYGYRGSPSKLRSVISDQAALLSQFQTLGDVKTMAFISQDGRRYVSSTPHYVPVDRVGEELSSPDDPSFHGFVFRKTREEEEQYWDMKSVLEYLGTLEAGGEDLILFTYSGHGEEYTGSLVTNATLEEGMYERMGVGNILDRMEELGGYKLLFIDSCFSGFFVPETHLSGTDYFSDKEKRELSGSSHIEAFLKALEGKTPQSERKDLWVMAASTSGQEAMDSLDGGDSPYQRNYGAFTYYLLKALGYDMEENRAKAREGRLTFYSLYREIRRAYPKAELKLQTPQVSKKVLDVVIRD